MSSQFLFSVNLKISIPRSPNQIFGRLTTNASAENQNKQVPRAIVEAKKNESAHVHHNWVRILALIPRLVAAANLLSVQLDLSIQLSISLSIQL